MARQVIVVDVNKANQLARTISVREFLSSRKRLLDWFVPLGLQSEGECHLIGRVRVPEVTEGAIPSSEAAVSLAGPSQVRGRCNRVLSGCRLKHLSPSAVGRSYGSMNSSPKRELPSARLAR
jgi:hypothetical protein